MSPTTKKLSAIKGRRFGSAAAKPQSLFAKTLGKQALRSEEMLATTTTSSNNSGAAVAEEAGK